MKNFGESLLYTVINIAGSFITLIFAFGAAIIEESHITKEEIFGRGEVIIICVPLCISVMYSIFYNKKLQGSFNFSSIIFWLTLFYVVFCAWIYQRFSVGSLGYTDNLYTFSLFTFFWTVFVMFISKLLDVPELNVREDRKKNLKDLEKKFDQIND